MTAQYKFTLIWNCADTGASETYYTALTSDTSAGNAIQAWLSARADCMYNTMVPLALRVSVYGQSRQSTLIRPPGGLLPGSAVGISLPGKGSRSPSGVSGPPATMNEALEFKVKWGAGFTKLRYMAGIPRQIIPQLPYGFDFASAPKYRDYVNTYLNLLANGSYFIEAQVPVANNGDAVIGIVSEAAAPSYVGIVINGANPNGTYKQGNKIALTAMRAAKGVRASTMNGTWYVDSVNTTLQPGNIVIYLRGSGTVDPNTQRFTDHTRIRPITKQLYQITGTELHMLRSHKRGKPSTSPRGRRLTYISLDP